MNASILSIGTELTLGQIFNKNAATLSARLANFSIQSKMHLTVPDERTAILKCLHWLEAENDLLFITGGLGPTTDDFTREVIAEWIGKSLVFDEPSWLHVTERLRSRGQPVREMQKQQCLFPQDSKILENAEGTAHAFQLKKNKCDVVVLPGPPREIDHIWNRHIAPWLAVLTKDVPQRITKAWDTIGLGESEVALIIEKALGQTRTQQQHQAFPFEIGYRVHPPYVEVKLSYTENRQNLNPTQRQTEVETLFQTIDKELMPILVTRDFVDVTDLLVESLRQLLSPSNVDFAIYDDVSTGYLLNRLSPQLRHLENWRFRQTVKSRNSNLSGLSPDFFTDEDNFLALLPYEEFSSIVLASVAGNRLQKVIEAPWRSPSLNDRRLQYFAEMALIELQRYLRKIFDNRPVSS